MSDKYLLVDTNNFAFRWFISRKSVEAMADDMFNNINSFASSLLCNKIILLADHGASVYRKEIYPEYKANRKKKTDKEKEKMDEFFKRFNQCKKILNVHFPLISFKGVEADDTIYWLTTKLKNTVILSTDADLLQCSVPQFAYTKGKYITLEEQGFANVNEFVEAKAIAGDTSDNIKGLERVGLKTVAKYFKKYDVGNFYDLKAAVPLSTKSKIEQRILAGTEIYERNIKLVDIEFACSEILTEQMQVEIMESIDEYYS